MHKGTQPVPPTRRLSVLYIEDNAPSRTLIERLLQRHTSAQLVTAGEGRVGLEIARAERPDLVILDLYLPDVDGLEVLRALQKDPATQAIPVVVLTADAHPEKVPLALEAGASDYLTKPLVMGRLLEIIRRLEEQHEAADPVEGGA